MSIRILAVLGTALLLSGAVHAEDGYVIAIRNQAFSPKELTIPSDQKVKIIIKNEDATPAEFESSDLNREKVVPANGQITVYIGPLSAGTYGYFNDFHRESTGVILVK